MSLWTKSYCVTIQIKATEQYIPLVLLNMLHKALQVLSLWMKSYSVLESGLYFKFSLVITALVSKILDYHVCLQTPSQRPMELE